MELLSLYGLFLAKTATVVVAIAAVVLLVVNVSRRRGPGGELKLLDLGEEYRERQRELRLARMGEIERKAWIKQFKKQNKSDDKLKKHRAKAGSVAVNKPCLYVLDFKGSTDAHEVTSLREEISAVLSVATAEDQVLLRLESPGGVVHGYGLAASQLERLRAGGIRLTIAVDKVAASGGYMMACVANRIIAAPFAIIGSIGVVAQIPNFSRLLKKNNIDIELHTAGQYKRTLTLLGENTDEGREKFREDLNHTHELFKQFVQQQRPSLDIDSVATGEYWYGTQAKTLGLIDDVGTSDDVLIAEMDNYEVVSVRYARHKRLMDRFTQSVASSADRLLLRWWQRGQKPLL